MSTNRRTFIAAIGTISLVPWPMAHASPSAASEAIQTLTGNKPLRDGRVKLDISPLVENGNLVPISVLVESPMTQADHVKAVHVISEGNPLPSVVSFYFGARAGRAVVSTRIRLLTSQRLWAIAEMNDGSFWQGHANTLVTLAACTEDILI